MKWKEFLKPTRFKLIIFALIFAYGIYSLFLFIGCFGPCTPIGMAQKYNLEFILVWPFFLYLSSSSLIFILRLISTFLWWYFISCEITWIYNRVKKKK